MKNQEKLRNTKKNQEKPGKKLGKKQEKLRRTRKKLGKTMKSLGKLTKTKKN